jgi:hypothetical protein
VKNNHLKPFAGQAGRMCSSIMSRASTSTKSALDQGMIAQQHRLQMREWELL